MTLNELIKDFCRKVNFNTAPSNEVRDRAESFLNETLQEVISEPGIAQWITRHEPNLTFASVANQWAYGVISSGRIESVRDRTTNFTLDEMSIEEWRLICSDPTLQTGTPSHWISYGTVAVAVQPSDASRIFAVSTSASDVQKLYVEGLRTGGYPQRVSVTLTGVTAIDINTATTDWVEITKVYLASAAIGTVTIVEDSGSGTVLATIPIGEKQTAYQGLILYPTPAGAITYYVDSERDLPTMVHQSDVPPIPARFHRSVLLNGALMKEYEKRDEARYETAKRGYAKGMSNFRYFVSCPSDFLPVMGGQTRERSRLGGSYPADNI